MGGEALPDKFPELYEELSVARDLQGIIGKLEGFNTTQHAQKKIDKSIKAFKKAWEKAQKAIEKA